MTGKKILQATDQVCGSCIQVVIMTCQFLALGVINHIAVYLHCYIVNKSKKDENGVLFLFR